MNYSCENQQIESAKSALKLSEHLKTNLTLNLLSLCGNDTSRVDDMLWKSVFDHPLKIFIDHKRLNSEWIGVVGEYLKNGIHFFHDVLEKILHKTEERSTFLLVSKTPSARYFAQTISRNYLATGKLYFYSYQFFNNKLKYYQKSILYFCLSYISDPHNAKLLPAMCELAEYSKDYISFLFFSFKGLILEPKNEVIETNLNEFLSLMRLKIRKTDPNYEMISTLASIIQSHITNDFKFIDEITLNFVTLFINLFSSIPETDYIPVTTQIFAMMILILENLRRNDSVRFENLLTVFVAIFQKICDEVLEKCGKTDEKFVIKNVDETQDQQSSQSESDSSVENLPEIFEYDYIPDFKSLEGLRTFKNDAGLKSQEFDIKSIAKHLQIIKLMIDWMIAWPEAIKVINDLLNVNLEEIFKNLVFYFPAPDIIPQENNRIVFEDICFFGHPAFIACFYNVNLNTKLSNSDDDIHYRILYISKQVQKGDIFKMAVIDPSTYEVGSAKPWFAEDSFKSIRKGRGMKTYTRRENCLNTIPITPIIAKPHLTRVHLICFYEVICNHQFIRELLRGTVFRVIVPEATLDVLDRLKAKDHIARSTAKFFEKNAYPKMIGFRVQRRQEYVSSDFFFKNTNDDKNIFRYVEGVIQAGIMALRKEPKHEPVVCLITSSEHLTLFGSDADPTLLTRDQLTFRSTILPYADTLGLKILKIEDFNQKFLDKI